MHEKIHSRVMLRLDRTSASTPNTGSVGAHSATRASRQLFLFLLQGIEGGLDFLGMFFGFCLQRGPCDLSVFDDERLPFGKSHGCWHAEGFRDLAIAVRNQSEGQLVFFLEFLLRFSRVLTHAENLQAFPVEVGKGIAQGASLRRAPGSAGFWIEVNERQALGVHVTETNGLSVLILSSNARSLGANCQRFGLGYKRKQAYRGKDDK